MTNDNEFSAPEILTPAEVARLFRVESKTVSQWAADGKLNSFRTPGGHRRFYKTDVMDLLNGGGRS